MKKLNQEIIINASRTSVWKTITDPNLYKVWASVFTSNSYYEGGWHKGDAIRFLAINAHGKKHGMVSEISVSTYPSYISIKHLGYIADGVEDTTSDAIKSWAPAYENYSLTEISSTQTLFKVDMDVEDNYYEMMLDKWPQAMEKMKDLSENQIDYPIYTCMWFNAEAKEATTFYSTIFHNFALHSQNDFVSSFEMGGNKFMAMNGGPMYKMTPAMSYFVYCGGNSEIERIYSLLIKGGMVIMPLDKYDWSSKYAWVQDKFGVNWQLDIDPVNSSQKIVPCLLFVNQKNTLVNEAVNFYTAIIKNSSTIMQAPYHSSANMPQGSILFAQYKLNGVIFNTMSSTMHHDYDFTPANSIVIECKTQEEIDYYWEKLGEGGSHSRCGWLTDRYGVSWQVIPDFLSRLTSDPAKAPAVIKAFSQMTKFEIEPLLNV